MKPIFPFVIALLLPTAAFAQDDPPLLLPEERRALDAQSDEFNAAIAPALAEVAKSTVRIWSGTRRLAYGTVVGDGTKVLSKWSEVARARGGLQVAAGDQSRSATVAGVYQDEDLVLLEIDGAPLVPVKWSDEVPKLGSFLAAPQPDGRLASFGVVSVLARNLRDTDMAYLGVRGDPDYKGQGVKIANVEPETGAAAAGLKAGNVILKVGERAISGLLELKNALTGTVPGSTVSLLVESKGRARTVKVTLGNRPEMEQFFGGRIQQMERMGGPISEVRGSFTQVFQTDMRPRPNQIGGPVVNLKGEVVGITMARADRTRSFVMPSAAVAELLKTDAEAPPLAGVEPDEPEAPLAAGQPRPRVVPPAPDEDRTRRHLTDMQRLMQHMSEEMQALENP